MAALVFPASPTVGQVYSANGRSWSWDGDTWNIVSGSSAAPSFIGCRAYSAVTQSVPNATATALTLGSESSRGFDTVGMHSVSSNTSRFTIQTPGYYSGSGAAFFLANATGVRQLYWRLNGSTPLAPIAQQFGSGTTDLYFDAPLLPIFLAAGDYLELVAYQNSGGALDVGSVAGEHSLVHASIYKIDGIVGPSGTIANGTAFPASPTVNQRFFRTDLGLDCYYDGTRWLTVGLTTHGFVVTNTLMPISASVNDNLQAVVDNGASGIWLERIVVNTYVSTTNNASNYWTVQPERYDTSGTVTSVGSAISSASRSANTPYQDVISVGAALATTNIVLRLNAAKVLSPGVLHYRGAIVYRLIVT